MITRRQFHCVVLAGCGAALLPSCGPRYDATVDLQSGVAVIPFATVPALATVGGSAIVQINGAFPIAVVRTAADAAAALSATCTHAGCILRYQTTLHCDCHGADFDLTGRVLGGPTVIPLPAYPTTVDADAIRVTVVG